MTSMNSIQLRSSAILEFWVRLLCLLNSYVISLHDQDIMSALYFENARLLLLHVEYLVLSSRHVYPIFRMQNIFNTPIVCVLV